MFKFIVQGQEIDEVVIKLKELTSRLDGKVKKETNIVSKKVEEIDEEYVEESAIGQSLNEVKSLDVNAELDSEGIPWDIRIHASSKAKVANGSWRLKRGADENEVNKIKIELRGLVSGHSIQPVRTPEVHDAQVSTSNTVSLVEAKPQIVESAPVVPLPTMNSGHTLETFKTNFPLVLGNLISEGKVTQEYINALKDHFKVTEIWMIDDAQKADLFENFVQYGLIKKVG